MIPYPTLDEVEHASIMQLAAWYRNLPSPGMAATEVKPPPPIPVFYRALEAEAKIMKRIEDRLTELGGWKATLLRRLREDIE